MKDEKNPAQELREKLFAQPKHAALRMSDDEIAAAFEWCEGYKTFLSDNRTEREITAFSQKLAEARGFEKFDSSKKYSAGDKVWFNVKEKAIILAVFGTRPLSDGVKIAAAHIDSPRLDVKPNPMYEDCEIALFKTHYYGGIKKYQWPTVPLSLHGVIVKADGEKITVSIGDKEGEPQFVISDLLPHLDSTMGERKASQVIKGEELNVLIGSMPFRSDEGSDLVKLNILKLLNEKYDITESDFLSAELELVPASRVSDIGFDRSLIGGYGHDDRVCAYPALMAALDCPNPSYTTVTVLTDKEEIGSVGNTGLSSAYLQFFIEDLAKTQGLEGRDVLRASECLSADVNAGVDPTFQSVHDKLNASFINRGIVVTKYTGARGKSDTSDANAEFVGKLRKLFDENNIVWQIGELGKVDEGGGAFYGPKIDMKIKDALGRPWQLGTVQFDFNLPERFNLTYVGADGKEHQPYMVHRALLGSIERFFGVLLEHYAGAFPAWLAPHQVMGIPVAEAVGLGVAVVAGCGKGAVGDGDYFCRLMVDFAVGYDWLVD